MKNATFYLLDNDTTVDGLSAVEQLVCEIAAERWRSGKRVLIACEDEKQAYRLDEALWARPAESFVPHNLAGEGPRGGAPVCYRAAGLLRPYRRFPKYRRTQIDAPRRGRRPRRPAHVSAMSPAGRAPRCAGAFPAPR